MKKKRIVLGALGVLCVGALVLAILLWNGMVRFNNPSSQRYPVRGVDVSSYQGDIDWETLSGQDVSFAFMKATEGSSFVDPRFAFNYREARKTGLRVGAYHFFSYDSPGRDQARHFINTVEPCENMLPPVVDLEFYGDKEKNPPAQEEVREQLDAMLAELEAHYGRKPILYATGKSYSLYLAGAYSAYDIWIRDVFASPHLPDGRQWTFWQYSDRGRLEGYRGKEKYIDFNVFYGTAQQFEQYAK